MIGRNHIELTKKIPGREPSRESTSVSSHEEFKQLVKLIDERFKHEKIPTEKYSDNLLAKNKSLIIFEYWEKDAMLLPSEGYSCKDVKFYKFNEGIVIIFREFHNSKLA